MAQSLTSADINSVANATDAFGENKGLLVCRPGRSLWKPYFTIPEGFYALVTNHGADINYPDTGKAVWPSGFHWGAPWMKVSNLVTKQSVVFDTPIKGCKTSDNVTVEIDVAIVFRILGDEALGEDPDLVRRFVHEVGPRGLENQLRGAQEEAVRAVARSLEHTEVYGLRTGGEKDSGVLAQMFNDSSQIHSALGEGHDALAAASSVVNTAKGNEICNAMKTRLNKQFVAQGVLVTAVMVQNVRLPENIVKQMTEKTMVISENNEQKNLQLSDMQQVSYNEEIETVKQRLVEEREQEKQIGTQKAKEVSIKLSNMKSLALKTLKLIKEETEVTIQKTQADGELQVSRLNNSKEAYEASLRAKSEKEEARIIAETSKYSEIKEAEAALVVAQNEAAADEMLAVAEGKMARMLMAKKAYETQLKRLEVAEALANNPNLVVSGLDQPDFNTLMMCDAILSEVKPGEQITRAQVLAELGVVQKNAKVYLNAHPAAMA